MAIRSVIDRLKRDISVTISVSPPLHAPQQIAQTPLLLALFPTDDFVDPDVHLEIPAFGKTADFILLVGEVLLASAHS